MQRLAVAARPVVNLRRPSCRTAQALHDDTPYSTDSSARGEP